MSLDLSYRSHRCSSPAYVPRRRTPAAPPSRNPTANDALPCHAGLLPTSTCHPAQVLGLSLRGEPLGCVKATRLLCACAAIVGFSFRADGSSGSPALDVHDVGLSAPAAALAAAMSTLSFFLGVSMPSIDAFIRLFVWTWAWGWRPGNTQRAAGGAVITVVVLLHARVVVISTSVGVLPPHGANSNVVNERTHRQVISSPQWCFASCSRAACISHGVPCSSQRSLVHAVRQVRAFTLPQ